MSTVDPIPTPESAPPPFREVLTDAIRFWELWRLLYNILLCLVVVAWVALTWPHFRPAMTLQSLLLLAILALIANLCYCVAYLIDIPVQRWAPGTGFWKRQRWALWSIGTLFAIVLANYWIVDEIYPFVG
jgi:hypothetical protein